MDAVKSYQLFKKCCIHIYHRVVKLKGLSVKKEKKIRLFLQNFTLNAVYAHFINLSLYAEILNAHSVLHGRKSWKAQYPEHLQVQTYSSGGLVLPARPK